jgi:acyl carrier protein
MNAALITLLVLAIVVWLYIEKRQVRSQVEATFRDRPHLSEDEFFAAHYQNSGIPRDVVVGVRKVLSDELQIDISRLTPSDDLSKNLRFLMDSYSMVDVAIVESLEMRFGIAISDSEAERTRTVDDVIRLIHQKATRP